MYHRFFENGFQNQIIPQSNQAHYSQWYEIKFLPAYIPKVFNACLYRYQIFQFIRV